MYVFTQKLLSNWQGDGKVMAKRLAKKRGKERNIVFAYLGASQGREGGVYMGISLFLFFFLKKNVYSKARTRSNAA